jgi:hypothetical protein
LLLDGHGAPFADTHQIAKIVGLSFAELHLFGGRVERTDSETAQMGPSEGGQNLNVDLLHILQFSGIF